MCNYLNIMYYASKYVNLCVRARCVCVEREREREERRHAAMGRSVAEQSVIVATLAGLAGGEGF
jgi:hypothetical protein